MAQPARSGNTEETSTRPGKNGGRLRNGNPGNKGGGRKPQKFATFLKTLRDDGEVHDAIERAARDETSRGFQPVLRVMSDYDDEKPAEKHAIVGPIEVRVRIEREGRRVTAS